METYTSIRNNNEETLKKLNGYAETFNQYLKKGSKGSITDRVPQRMLSLIHDEFDDEREEAEWHNENLFLQATNIELAVQYVRNRIDMQSARSAKRTLGSHNMELADVNEKLSDEIHDLMEEYGDEYGLPEGWWENEGTTEDILWEL